MSAQEYRAQCWVRAPGGWSMATRISGPVAVTITFILPRPLGHYGTGANRGQLKPSAPRRPAGQRMDLDKLARSTLDALTGVVWVDDGQVADLNLSKVYQASPTEQPGAVIEITWTGEDS